MIKVVGLLKRRADLSPAQFRDYYERHHRLLGEKYLTGHAVKYTRRYLLPQARGLSADQASPFDVILEIWYPDQAALDAAHAVLSAPQVQAEIMADEEQLFERAANRFFTVDEVESQLQ